MEKAVFISKLSNLNYVHSQYTRLYFGNEFCQKLIPSLEDVKHVCEFVRTRNLDFTFVTAYLTDDGIEQLRPVAQYLIKNVPSLEIVINDWGFSRILRNEFGFTNIVLGRLVSKQKRGPRILTLVGKVPAQVIEHFRESNCDVPLVCEFLLNMGIYRVELDNLLQGICRASDSLKASLYFPFAYVSTTRNCIAAFSRSSSAQFSRSIAACNKECQEYVFKLQTKTMPVEIFLKGNSQFFKNEKLPDNLSGLNIDRLVYEPEIPL